MYKYEAKLYSGRVYCGNGLFNTIEECIEFLKDDGFCDKVIVIDLESGEKQVIKL